MEVDCIYDSPRETCRAVLELYKSPKGRKSLFAIQYNRFLSQSTTWWLSPVGVNPAYKYAKFCFVPCRDVPCVPCADGEIMVGLYIEKGLGRESQVSRTLTMDSSWSWHTFLDEMETDRFSSALNSIQSETRVQPIIYIESLIASERDCICYEWEPRDGKFYPIGHEFKGATSDSMNQVHDVHSLAECLRGLTTNPFVWIDMIVGIPMGLKGGSADSWNAASIERNLLQYLEPWVR